MPDLDFDDVFMLMDGRAWTDASDALVLSTGSLAECVRDANAGIYGKDCVVARPDGKPAFELFGKDGVWRTR